MKSRLATLLVPVLVMACASGAWAAKPSGGLKKGDKLQTLANLHPDMNKHVLYTMNYQLPGIIPVCSEVTITKLGTKKIAFEYQGQKFQMGYDNFTKKAGVAFSKSIYTYLGPACDRAKMQSLSQADQEGIRVGRPSVGMTREGLMFAMGRPPYHANPTLDGPTWHYWRNRFARMQIDFDSSGKVSSIQ